MTCSCSVPQLRTFFLLTFPEIWKLKTRQSLLSHQLQIARPCLHRTRSDSSCHQTVVLQFGDDMAKLKFLPQHFPYCGFWDRKFPTGSCRWLPRVLPESFTNAINSLTLTPGRPASALTLTDTPFVYKVPIPNSDWVGFSQTIVTCRCEASLNFLAHLILWNHTHCAIFSWGAIFFDSDGSGIHGSYVKTKTSWISLFFSSCFMFGRYM
jgi:hypothetical protein